MPQYNKKYAKLNIELAQKVRKSYFQYGATMTLIAQEYNIPLIKVSDIVHDRIFKQEEYGYENY